MAIMTSRQASELDFALERNGWTSDDVKKASGGDVLAQLLLVVRGQAQVAISSIFAFVRTVKIAAQKLAVTTSAEYFSGADVKSMGENFKAQFLGFEVGATDEAELAVRKLKQNSLDAPILTELGNKAETSVRQFWAFLDANRGSSEWFIFYLRGKDGKLWAVLAYWYGDLDVWSVEAHSVEDRNPWLAGYQVISRN